MAVGIYPRELFEATPVPDAGTRGRGGRPEGGGEASDEVCRTRGEDARHHPKEDVDTVPKADLECPNFCRPRVKGRQGANP